MKTKFCIETFDISLLLSQKEAIKLKRTNEHIPCLTAECDNLIFHLMNSREISNNDYIKLKEPKDKFNPHYWILMSDRAYEDLMNDKQCGIRYGQSSKLNIIIESL